MKTQKITRPVSYDEAVSRLVTERKRLLLTVAKENQRQREMGIKFPDVGKSTLVQVARKRYEALQTALLRMYPAIYKEF